METPAPKRRRQYRTWMRLPQPVPPKATRHRNERADGISSPPEQMRGSENNTPAGDGSIMCEHEQCNTSSPNNSFGSSRSSLSSNSGESYEERHSDSDCTGPESISGSRSSSSSRGSTDNFGVESLLSDNESIADQPSSVKTADKVDTLDEEITSNNKTTRFEVLLMILNFSFRHGLSAVARNDLCKLVNEVLGTQCIPDSDHWFKKVFGKIDYNLHFYCSKCGGYICELSTSEERKGSVPCPVPSCDQICNKQTLNSGNFFITLPITDQLKFLLENTEDIKDLLGYRWNRNRESDIISDVFDGLVYKELEKDNNFLSEKWNLSVTFNTDGANVFKSTKNTLWPIFVRMNELPPKLRFHQNFNLLAGLWFGSKDPDMSVYLSPFVEEMQGLYSKGFTWEPVPGEIIHSKVILLLGVFDSVAKPKVQQHHQFNGYWGCAYCYHPGVVLDEIDSNHAKFIMNRNQFMLEDMSATYTVTKFDKTSGCNKTYVVEDRKDNEMRQHMVQVEEIKNASNSANTDEIHVKGVKGISPLYPLFFFNLVFNFGIDYMHGVLLGCCKTVTNLWLDKDSNFYIGDRAVREMERRLKTITPPTCISRRPRPLADRIHWKANEWRSWLLFYSLPCAVGSVPSSYLKHHCLLVTACSILLQESITKDDLRKASWYLVLYVMDVQKIYGKPQMGYNFHILLHLGKVVSLHGPLWCFSLFSFESANGFLIKLVKGTKGVMAQIAEKYSISRLICNTLGLYRVSTRIKDFCEDLLSYQAAAIAVKIKSVTLLGSVKRVQLSGEELAAFEYASVTPRQFSYERFIKDGVMYHSRCYSRKGTKSDDSAIQLKDGSYALIERISVVECPERRSVHVLLRTVVTTTRVETYCNQGAKAEHIRRCSARVFGCLFIHNAEGISCKVLLMRCGNDTFVGKFPNMFEKD